MIVKKTRNVGVSGAQFTDEQIVNMINANFWRNRQICR